MPWWGWQKRFRKSLDQFALERIYVKISEQCRIAPSVMGEKGWQRGGEHHPWVPAPSEIILLCAGLSDSGDANSTDGPLH